MLMLTSKTIEINKLSIQLKKLEKKHYALGKQIENITIKNKN